MGLAPALADTRRAVRAVLPPAGTVLVACSGGADSLALAAATAFEAPRAGVRAGLVSVDHGLQPGSDDQATRVAELGRTLGLDPVEVLRVEVGRAGGPEGAAREARYAAIAELAGELDARVLLGHTRDDQAETVLLGLGRGSGPRSIGGMTVVDGRWLRPFLGIDRATTAAACAAQNLAVWNDPMNLDPAFARVRLRREVLPLLEDVLHGGVAASLARTADLLRDDLDALDAWATDALDRASSLQSGDQLLDPVVYRPDRGVDHRRDVHAIQLDVGELAELPRAVRTRVLRMWATGAGAGPLTATHTAAMDALVTSWRGQGPVPLPGGSVARTSSARLAFVPGGPTVPPHDAPPAPQE